MPISLHAAIVPSMIQILGAGQGWLDKAAGSGLDETELVETRLIEDMLPFSYQVKSMAVHSMGAIEGVRKGSFSPDMSDPPDTIKALKMKLGEAENFLKALSEGELESFVGRDMCFEMAARNFRIDFTAENFLLSFSQPQFYFHATTAYDILRQKGLDIGKVDFMGQLQRKA